MNERQIKQNTLDIYRVYEHKFHTYNVTIYKECKKDKITYSEIKANSKLEKTIRDHLNELEFICVGINIGIYDIDVLERLYGDVMVRLYEQLYDYIDFRRKERKTNIVFMEYEIDVKKMKKIQQRKELLNRQAEFEMNI